MVNASRENLLHMNSCSVRHNVALSLSNTPETSEILNRILADSKDVAEGRIRCTLTKHRVAKAAILFGIKLLSRKPKEVVLSMVESASPVRKPGRNGSGKRVKAELVLECASTQGLLEGVDKLWRAVGGKVSHRRVTTACLVIGLESLNKVDPGQVRRLVSKVCPVPKKYFDKELQDWL